MSTSRRTTYRRPAAHRAWAVRVALRNVWQWTYHLAPALCVALILGVWFALTVARYAE